MTGRALRRRPGVLIGALLIGVLAPAPAWGQDDAWQFSIVPYLWLPSVDTQFQMDGVPVEVETNTDTSDIFDKLDFALLLCGEVRKGKVGVLYDFQFLQLSDGGTSRGPVARTYDADVTFADATLALQYRLIEQPKFLLDGLAGARVLYADVSADLAAGPILPALSGGDSEAWVDPIVGAKVVWSFGEKWALHGYADIGGFGVGSDLTYQLMGTVSYRFNEHFAIHGGYRLFDVDFERDEFEFDATMHGPIIGLAFTF